MCFIDDSNSSQTDSEDCLSVHLLTYLREGSNSVSQDGLLLHSVSLIPSIMVMKYCIQLNKFLSDLPILKKIKNKPGVVVHSISPSTWEQTSVFLRSRLL